MKTITFRRVKMSARDLVARWYGDRGVDDEAVHDAGTEMMRRGWLTGFMPKSPDWERSMVFVPQHNDFAAIIRYVDYTGAGVVPRGLIESRTQLPLANIGTGLFLSYIGIGIGEVLSLLEKETGHILVAGETHKEAPWAKEYPRPCRPTSPSVSFFAVARAATFARS